MLQSKIALIDQTGKMQLSHLTRVAGAIQTQVNRDLAKHWPVSATITVLEVKDTLPADVWAVNIVETLPDGEGGYHWDTAANQPYADVLTGPGWTVAASHEICEMLVDPWGNRLQTGPQIVIGANGMQHLGGPTVSYLVEICDPCEAYGYVIDLVPVSDFILPAFYEPGTEGLRYSYTGAVATPFEVIPGGYISWVTAAGEMMQLTFLDPPQAPTIVDLGSTTNYASLKQMVDDRTQATVRVSRNAQHPAVRAGQLEWMRR